MFVGRNSSRYGLSTWLKTQIAILTSVIKRIVQIKATYITRLARMNETRVENFPDRGKKRPMKKMATNGPDNAPVIEIRVGK